MQCIAESKKRVKCRGVSVVFQIADVRVMQPRPVRQRLLGQPGPQTGTLQFLPEHPRRLLEQGLVCL
jgi:hypothetical protein